MLKVVNGEAPKTTKLILGFDAGCGTCADLAAGVQEKVGDKLEVQNLNDPQLMAWREEALGKDAKWTPTLFEVEGEKVLKAWAGWRMGYALSRKLGPSSTWQVMQALGEVGGAPKVEESSIVEKLPEKAAEAVSGMSRGQFLKGVGGAAVAASVLSSGMLFPSVAEAATAGPRATSGTTRQRAIAIAVVRNSTQFKAQVARQNRIGAKFDLNRALIKVVESLAVVRVRSAHNKRTITLVFVITLPQRKVYSHVQQDIYPKGTEEAKVLSFADGKLVPRYGELTFSRNHIIMPNGRRMTLEQFKADARRRRPQQLAPQQEGFVPAPDTPCNRCFQRSKNRCIAAYGVVCGALGAAIGAPSGIGLLIGGAVAGTSCSILADYSGGCSNRARSASGGCLEICSDKKPPSDRKPPPSRPAPPTGSC